MKRNDVLGVGAAASILLFSSAWLTGYWDNRLVSWVGIFTVITISSGVAWFTREKHSDYKSIAKSSALFSIAVYIGASLLGLIVVRWAHGSWDPELSNTTEGVLSKIFSNFPGSFMRNILHPSLYAMVIGSLLLSIWSALGSSFLPIPQEKTKKGRK